MAQKPKFAAPFKTPPAGNKITSFFSQVSTPGVDVSSIIGIAESQNSQNQSEEPQPHCSFQDPPLSTKRTFTFKTPKQRFADKNEDSDKQKTKSPLVVKWPSAWPHKGKTKSSAKNQAKNAKNGPKDQKKNTEKTKIPAENAKKQVKKTVGAKSVKKSSKAGAAQNDAQVKGKNQAKVKDNADRIDGRDGPAKKAAKRKANQEQSKPNKKQAKQENQAQPIKKKKTGAGDGGETQNDTASEKTVTDPQEPPKNTTGADEENRENPPALTSTVVESQTPIFSVATQPPGSPGIPSYQVPKTSTPIRPSTPRMPFFERMAAKSPAVTPLKKIVSKVKKATSAKKSKSKALKKSMNKTFPECSQGVFEFTLSPQPQMQKSSSKRNKKKQKQAEQELRHVIIKMQNEIVIFRQRRLRLRLEEPGPQEMGVITMIQPLNA